MQKELLMFISVVVIALFMTIHNRNLNVINASEDQANEHKINRDNLLMQDGQLIRLSNGVTLSRSSDLIIIRQANSTIFFNKSDAPEIVAFLEE